MAHNVSPASPPLSPSSLLFTGGALLAAGTTLKVAQIFSHFLLQTFLETATVYLLGKFTAVLLDKTPLAYKWKLLATNIAMLAAGYFFLALPLASVAASMAIFNFQSAMGDSFCGAGAVVETVKNGVAFAWNTVSGIRNFLAGAGHQEANISQAQDDE